jgi:hypothetical protein
VSPTGLYVVSTGNGPDGLLDTIWRQAQEGVGRWQAVFYAWSAHPGRVADPHWYRLNVAEAAQPRLARREYASSAEEAVAAPEGVFFERWDSQVNVVATAPTPN